MRFLLTVLLFGTLASTHLTAQTAGSATEGASPDTTASASAPVPASPAPPAASALVESSTRFGFGLTEDTGISTGPIPMTAGTYAVFHTSEGDILVRLFTDKAPKTVENFIGLATGRKPWKHPITLAEMRSPLYNNTTIYKTVENALLYGGDPINRGVGEPGYTLAREESDKKAFEEPGILAASLAGGNSSGSRWFFALRSFPGWSERFTAFGRIVGGMDVARTISRRPTKKPTVPLDPVLVNSIEILEVPAGKKTVATYSDEEGKRYLTVERAFQDDTPPAPVQTARSDQSTTGPAEQTTATLTVANGKKE